MERCKYCKLIASSYCVLSNPRAVGYNKQEKEEKQKIIF